jgi:hypothetical protein
MELHIGTEIRKVLEQKGITPDWLAQKISTSRRNLYDILTRDEISTGQLSEISRALDFDFFSLYRPVQANEPHGQYNRLERKRVSIVVELDGLQTTLENWCDTLKKINAAL